MDVVLTALASKFLDPKTDLQLRAKLTSKWHGGTLLGFIGAHDSLFMLGGYSEDWADDPFVTLLDSISGGQFAHHSHPDSFLIVTIESSEHGVHTI